EPASKVTHALVNIRAEGEKLCFTCKAKECKSRYVFFHHGNN
ncbi:hypothetical protein Nmel_010338, partial [Mimus melanotis]